jgi:AcrR family transcriptional regulator
VEQNQIIEEMLNNTDELTEKQKQILAAATEIFAEKGFAATSTNEIAKKAGVAEGTIFRHYKSKKHLLFSIVTPMMIKLVAPIVIKDINKVLNYEYENIEDFVRAMIENRAQFLKKNFPTVRILIQEIPFHSELRDQFIEHIGSKVFARLREIIEYYQEKNQICNIDPNTVIRLSGSAIIGYFITKHAIAREAEWNDEVEIERTVQFLVKGLAPE